MPRRIIAASVIGATSFFTLFVIALGCTCKLIHLRLSEQRASSRLLNPQQYIYRRREELQRQSNHNRPLEINENSNVLSDDVRRLAPPSYNQTMGFADDDEERNALLAEYLRMAGLDHFIPIPLAYSSSRISRHRSRRHRRHRHRQHRHHRRRSRGEGNIVHYNRYFRGTPL